MITNCIITVGTSQWKIKEAVSMEAAESAISMARVTGSVGSKTTSSTFPNGIYEPPLTITLADVVRLNDDGSECEPS